MARLYAITPRAAIDLGNGVEHAPSSNDAIRAVAILMAITKRENDGVVEVDEGLCIGCKTCVEACPTDALTFIEIDPEEKKAVYVVYSAFAGMTD